MNYQDHPIHAGDFDSVLAAIDNEERMLLNTILETKGKLAALETLHTRISGIRKRVLDGQEGKPDNVSEEKLKILDNKLSEAGS
jgi:hypothetical protein